MSWTKPQRQRQGQACASVGMDRADRHLVLRQFKNAMCDGQITAKSRYLTNDDFEKFMAIIEDKAGGQLLHFKRGHFQAKVAGGDTARQCHLVRRFERELIGKVEFNLSGWIRSQVIRNDQDPRDQPEQLEGRELYDLIESMKAFGRRNGVWLTS